MRADEFIAKANQRLKWGSQFLEEMRQHGRHMNIEDVERIFVANIQNIGSIHEALLSAARKLNQPQWCDQLQQTRQNDLLLRYLWKARDSEVHDSLVKWSPNIKYLELKVVDANKANKVPATWAMLGKPEVANLFCYIYGAKNVDEFIERFKANPKPPIQKMTEAGVEILQQLDTLGLRSFSCRDKGKVVTIAEPTAHLGASIPPMADQAVFLSLKFYQGKLDELVTISGIDSARALDLTNHFVENRPSA